MIKELLPLSQQLPNSQLLHPRNLFPVPSDTIPCKCHCVCSQLTGRDTLGSLVCAQASQKAMQQDTGDRFDCLANRLQNGVPFREMVSNAHIGEGFCKPQIWPTGWSLETPSLSWQKLIFFVVQWSYMAWASYLGSLSAFSVYKYYWTLFVTVMNKWEEPMYIVGE